MFHEGAPGARLQHDGPDGRVSGPAPEHASYGSFVSFRDPTATAGYAEYMVAEQAGAELPT